MDSNRPIRILNIVPNMSAAGIETFIMNIYRSIDTTKIQFDFLVHNKSEKFYDKEILKMGGKIYRLSYKEDKKFLKYIRDLNEFFKEHKEYKIVHGHMQSMMPIYLFIAKKNGVPVRIAHSHNNSYEKSLKGYILHILSRFSKSFSTINFACSKKAGQYLFKNKKFDVINNGINVEKFKYDDKIRKKIRESLGLSETDFLLGNIGRLEKQKNQLFLLDVFKKAYQENKNLKLLIIGDGSREKLLKKYANELGINNRVIFLKNINNVNEYMFAMDVFLLPSLYEGLGIVLIEAQYSGLQCITTKDTVAEETKISKKIKYIPLIEEEWVKSIKEVKKGNRNVELYNQNFNIKIISKKIEDMYIELNNK